jgi:hypothetical protein
MFVFRGEVEKKERRQLGFLVNQLLDNVGERAFDALIQVTAANSQNAGALSSIVR